MTNSQKKAAKRNAFMLIVGVVVGVFSSKLPFVDALINKIKSN